MKTKASDRKKKLRETMSNDKLLQKVQMLDMGGPLVFVVDPKQASKCAALGNNIL